MKTVNYWSPVSRKSFLITWLLTLFVGFLGIDRFYLGKVGTGLLKLVTCGGFGLWYLVDLFLVLIGRQTDSRGYRVTTNTLAYLLAWVITLLILFGGGGTFTYNNTSAPTSTTGSTTV